MAYSLKIDLLQVINNREFNEIEKMEKLTDRIINDKIEEIKNFTVVFFKTKDIKNNIRVKLEEQNLLSDNNNLGILKMYNAYYVDNNSNESYKIAEFTVFKKIVHSEYEVNISDINYCIINDIKTRRDGRC